MRTYSTLTALELSVIESMYKTHTDYEIGQHIGRAKKTVWKHRHINGWLKDERPAGDRFDGQIRALYKTHTDPQIAAILGINKTTVWKRRKDLGLVRSSYKTNKRVKQENDDYVESAKLLQAFLSRRAA